MEAKAEPKAEIVKLGCGCEFLYEGAALISSKLCPACKKKEEK